MNVDDTMDTIDTAIDTAAIQIDLTEIEDAVDTELLPALEPEDLDVTVQTAIGGLPC